MNKLLAKIFGITGYAVKKIDTDETVAIIANKDGLKDIIIDDFNENGDEHFQYWKSLHFPELSNEEAFIHYYSLVLKPQYYLKAFKFKSCKKC